MLCGCEVASVAIKNGVANEMERCDNTRVDGPREHALSSLFRAFIPFNACVDHL